MNLGVMCAFFSVQPAFLKEGQVCRHQVSHERGRKESKDRGEEAMAKIMGRERLAFIRGSRSGLRSMSRKNSESV